MVYDFHTHSFFSDGVLSPIELIRRAHVAGYKVIGVTDHASLSNLELIIKNVIKDCLLASEYWDIIAIPGVELTHVPAKYIDKCADKARQLGAKLIVVHGETIVEPVEGGTNLVALNSPNVDILAHPGLLTAEEAQLAAKNNIFLEITSRGGHSLTNGLVAKTALAAGAKLLINSDSHHPHDLLNLNFARSVGRGAGIEEDQLKTVFVDNPRILLQKLGY